MKERDIINKLFYLRYKAVISSHNPDLTEYERNEAASELEFFDGVVDMIYGINNEESDDRRLNSE